MRGKGRSECRARLRSVVSQPQHLGGKPRAITPTPAHRRALSNQGSSRSSAWTGPLRLPPQADQGPRTIRAGQHPEAEVSGTPTGERTHRAGRRNIGSYAKAQLGDQGGTPAANQHRAQLARPGIAPGDPFKSEENASDPGPGKPAGQPCRQAACHQSFLGLRRERCTHTHPRGRFARPQTIGTLRPE